MFCPWRTVFRNSGYTKAGIYGGTPPPNLAFVLSIVPWQSTENVNVWRRYKLINKFKEYVGKPYGSQIKREELKDTQTNC